MTTSLNPLGHNPENHSINMELEQYAEAMGKKLIQFGQAEMEAAAAEVYPKFFEPGDKKNILNIISGELQNRIAINFAIKVMFYKRKCEGVDDLLKETWNKVKEIACTVWDIRIAAAKYGSDDEHTQALKNREALSKSISEVNNPVEGLDKVLNLFMTHDLYVPLASAKIALTSKTKYKRIYQKI